MTEGRVDRSVPPWAGAAILGLSLVGCGASADTPKNELLEGQTLTVQTAAGLAMGHVRAEDGHVAQGTNAFVVDFDPPVTIVTAASAFMPAMGHGTLPPTIARAEGGYRVSNFVFSMPGLWTVTLELGVGKETDELEFNLDVP